MVTVTTTLERRLQHRDGTSLDCDLDGVPDECQLVGNDCNGNGIPDQCDTDCNGNGIPDDCETGFPDCNQNGIPDECERTATATTSRRCDIAEGTSQDCNNNVRRTRRSRAEIGRSTSTARMITSTSPGLRCLSRRMS